MRIDIIGQPAGGKSRLASAIAKKLSIPHIQIDRFWFENGGRHGAHDTPNIEWVRAQVKNEVLKRIQEDAWVSDGTYSFVQEYIGECADVILFLDIPLFERLYNHGSRFLFGKKERHKELNLWDEMVFFHEIIKRAFTRKELFKSFQQKYKDKIITLRSRNEISTYLHSL
jgi:adenylate kinase family enzyme